MSTYNKKKLFYFMKPDNFYERDDIKRIDKMEHAGDILTLYDKLIFYTMNRDGLLAHRYKNDYENYSVEEIAEDFNYPVELVKETLEILLKLNTIELTDNGFYFFPDSLEYTKSTTVGAESKKEQRNKKKLEKSIEESIECENEKVDKCPEYIHINTKEEIQEELQQYTNKEKDKNIKKEKEVDINTKEQLYNKYNKEINEIISYLNNETNKKFTTESEFVKDLIVDRLEENHTIDDFKFIIDRKTKEWLNNKEFNKNLRPGTLFSKNNFERYLNESVGIVSSNNSLLNSVLLEMEND